MEGPGSLDRQASHASLAPASCEPWVKLSALSWNGTCLRSHQLGT